jgi:hypothetical protein
MKTVLLFLAFIFGLMNYSCSRYTRGDDYENNPSYSIDSIYTEKRFEYKKAYETSPLNRWKDNPLYDTIEIKIAHVSVFDNDISMNRIKRYIHEKYNVDEVVINRPASFYFKRSANTTVAGVSSLFISYKSDNDIRQAAKIMEKNNQ